LLFLLEFKVSMQAALTAVLLTPDQASFFATMWLSQFLIIVAFSFCITKHYFRAF